MKAIEVRNWLGIYFLGATFVLGAYLLLFGGGRLLPFERSDATAAFQIIVPVFIGQLAIIARWFTTNPPDPDTVVNIPNWLVKGPTIGALAVIGLTIVLKIASNYSAQHGGAEFVSLLGDDFKTIVTFCVSILNATTIYVVAALFGAKTE